MLEADLPISFIIIWNFLLRYVFERSDNVAFYKIVIRFYYFMDFNPSGKVIFASAMDAGKTITRLPSSVH